ncbi:MAG: glucosidase [Candidatus Poribacteria bacterium]|nr:glucosidase [Candidatus Poribacteria bacterium]
MSNEKETQESTQEPQGLHEPSTDSMSQWRKWGPYVSERSWGTVREDYSSDGAAWDFLPHDLARSKAYRWGEDGLAGWCDRYQILVFALALWNGRDPILKERLFGLTPNEANHGEDVKEYYFYLDGTPDHAYMKYLYKYPQAEYPYAKLIEENRQRGGTDPEYELLDTGIFDEDRYFDVFVEYAKANPEDTCVRIEVFNRGPEDAPIHILPHLWFRNTWAWGPEPKSEPSISVGPSDADYVSVMADDADAPPLTSLPFEYRLGKRYLYGQRGAQPLFTSNETHAERVFGPSMQSRTPHVKDAFHRHIINGEDCVNPDRVGTKACLHYANLNVPAGESVVIRLRLTDALSEDPVAEVDGIVAKQRAKADEFYKSIHPPKATEDECRIQRQAFAGMLWTKQIYLFDVRAWLEGDNENWPPPESHSTIRNVHWRHLNSMRILSMPDKWEYPWFAAWDLAFHAITLVLIDPEFAKQQLWLMLFEQFQHPSGQIPAYEWEFSDLNPPVHAWAVWRVYNMDRVRSGKADRLFLERCFHKLLINFTWWVNKVDSEGNNVFEGGFLGLDNITVIDRSHEIPGGATLEQSDATGWMGMFCQNMMRIALELAKENPAYESLATKFLEHYVYIGAAMKQMGDRNYQLWDEADGFFYDVLRYPNGDFHKFRVRSLVGLIPLYAIERLEENWIEPFEVFRADLHWLLDNRQDLVQQGVTTLEHDNEIVHVLAIINPEQMHGLLNYLWDTNEFRSDYGLRSLSKYHEKQPFVFGDNVVRYEPAESFEMLKGGNSNWRGPVWFPTSFLMIESIRKLGKAYGSAFTIEGAADGGKPVSLDELARGFANSLIRLFTRDASGRRPIYGDIQKFQEDPHWRDYILFYEYFHGDTGKGLGASHQTGWTGLVANLIDEWRR